MYHGLMIISASGCAVSCALTPFYPAHHRLRGCRVDSLKDIDFDNGLLNMVPARSAPIGLCGIRRRHPLVKLSMVLFSQPDVESRPGGPIAILAGSYLPIPTGDGR
ncbi:hypothetical protein C8Q77DRAFT_881002 [Trametes polyzona]|nr:hypothetical protein C8Q77DRAFT_881002 [Trametes polyzona]